MIPKIIHYCWFGKGPMPELEKKCIDSWRNHLSDYTFMLWNEENFDIERIDFVREAYEANKYAFVSDYVRIYALYHFGGIYLDTDVEVLRPLDIFLDHPFFFGFEKEESIQTGLIGSHIHHPMLKKILSYYNEQSFILKNGKYNMLPNPKVITPMLIEKYDLVLENSFQNLNDELIVYPIDYFCAKDWQSGRIVITENTYTIHHFSGSWYSKKKKIKKIVKSVIGISNTEHLINLNNKMKLSKRNLN